MTHIFLLKSSREKIPFPNDELLWPAKPILKLVPRRHRDPRHDMTSILFGSIPAKLRKAANDDVLRAQSARTWSRLCNDGGSTEMDASSFFCCLMFRSVESYPFFTWPGVRTPQSNDTFSSCEIWKVWKCGSIFHRTLGAAMSWTSKVWPDR